MGEVLFGRGHRRPGGQPRAAADLRLGHRRRRPGGRARARRAAGAGGAEAAIQAGALAGAGQRAQAGRHPPRTLPADGRGADLARVDPLVPVAGRADARRLGHDRNLRNRRTINRPDAIRIGSIGRAVDGVEVRLDDTTGEILLRGPNVILGYLNQPEKTAETIDGDGWLHTGDVGEVDAQGFFRITDRMKDIIITAGGKNVTPSEWENELKFSPYITDAVIIGDKRAYLTAIVMIDQENVEKYAQDHDVPFSNYASLARAPEVRALIQSEVDRVNNRFARVEQVKKFWLLEAQLGAEDEELTPTMKLKRKLVQEKYAAQIEGMYQP
ncbi:MAG: AMP-binding protein [Rubrivivax sp.]|nr:AMP-binding protein [Rubrivivax sp.]